MGTRLTRLTWALLSRDPDHALRRAGAVGPTGPEAPDLALLCVTTTMTGACGACLGRRGCHPL